MTTHIDDFESRVVQLVSRAHEARAAAMREPGAGTADQLRAQSALVELAERLHRAEVRPRMEAVARHFDGARLQHARTADGSFSKITLPHDERSPVGAMLTMGVRFDPAARESAVTYRLETDVLHVETAGHDELRVRLDAPDTDAVVGWVERKLLEFVEGYLRGELDSRFRKEAPDTPSPRFSAARQAGPAADAPAPG